MVDPEYRESYETWYNFNDDPQITTYFLRHTTLLDMEMRNGRHYKIVWAVTSLERFLKGYLHCRYSSNFDIEWWSEAIYNLLERIASIRMLSVKWSLDMDEMLADIKEEARRIQRQDFEWNNGPKIKLDKITTDIICFIGELKKWCYKLRDEGH